MSTYSDLFAALAFIFLFLYVVSTVQLSLETISSNIEFDKYEAQLKEYKIPAQESDQIMEEEPAELNYEKVLARLALLEKETAAASELFNQRIQAFQDVKNELINGYQDAFRHIKKRNSYLGAELSTQKRENRKKSIQYEAMLSEQEKKHNSAYEDVVRHLTQKEKEITARKEIQKDIETANVDLMAIHDNLEKEINAQNNKIVKLEIENKEIVGKRKKIQRELTENKDKVKELLRERTIDTAEKIKLISSRDKMEDELSRNLKELRQQEREKTNAVTEKRRLAAAQKKLENELAKSRTRLENNERHKRVSSAEKNRLAAMYKKLEKDLNQSKAKNRAMEKKIRLAAADKGKLEASRKMLLNDLGKNRGKLYALKKSKDAAVAGKKELLATRKALETAQKKLEGELDQASNKLLALEKEKDAADSEKEKLLAEKEKFEDGLGKTTEKLKALEQEKTASDAEKMQLAAAGKELKKKLGDYQKKEQLRKTIISNLKNNFENHNINAEIDEDSGEVILPFKKTYFDFDSAKLKKNMAVYLRKIIPVYAQSIFGEDDIYKFIQSIEVVGFASPIYKGKYVNPHSLSDEARDALNYNMDLSYRRAHSIFRYILDTRNMNYKKQKDLMMYLKVTGRSYLESSPEKILAKNDIAMDDFCSRNNCEKYQRAVIRFNLIK